MVVSGSGDRTVRVWDLATGAAVCDPFTGHNAWVRSVAVGQLDGRTIVVSGSDDWHGAGVGRGHRHPGRRPVHRPHQAR